ncbi:uncharacterized protein LOC118645406 [Monomorium pharaonis]|uniref:uncharacterized protein LOC118645406 n=1 Tax=Monomorium pharaonis TaxID=307658 RepID=UPI0017479A30|nr:uncharacterized protein LOC118645406 [Monomorium pharaonis]
MPAVSLFKTKEKQLKTSELRLASFVLEHNISFNAVDHLINIVRNLPSDSDFLKDMSCNRTKCIALVKNVLGKESLQNQVIMMKEKHFSIIIDESTDVASIKSLAICVRYVVNCRPKDNFLHLLPVPEANATTLHSTLIAFFHEHEIDYKSKMVGFAADGASVMMGHHHSVQALLKRDISNLRVFKCICHSLALCASQPCTKLPRTPETLLREIYSYFKYSYKKISQFKEFQEFVEARPHKILHPSQTRWLSLYSSVKRILEQYNALILFFRMAAFEEKNQQAEHIFDKLTDPLIKLTFQFLKFVLPLFCDLNLLFQAESFQLHNIYQSMYTTYVTILEFFIKPDLIKVDPLGINYNDAQNYLSLDEIYLGGEVTAVLIDNSCNINAESLVVFKTNCLHFYIEVLNQINKRFPFDSEFYKGLKELGFLNPANISGTKIPPNTKLHVTYLLVVISHSTM